MKKPNLIVIFFLFQMHCSPGKDSFYIKTKIPLPAENDIKGNFYEKKDLHYLLRGGKSSSKNKTAVITALKGNWKDALEIWNHLPDDCIVKNNRGMALQVTGRTGEGMRDLMQAYFECPDKKEIRLNYEKSLSRIPAPAPEYKVQKKQNTDEK